MTVRTDTSDSRPTVPRAAAEAAAMPMSQAQFASLFLLVPFAAASVIPHVYLWGFPDGNPFPFSLLAAFLLSILVHEGLHGIGYYWAGANRSDIEFGIKWSALAPYAHCSVPLRATPYRVAVALPGVVLGVAPLIAGLALGWWWLTMYAFLMLSAAAGDALLIWTLGTTSGDTWTQDHPSKMGCLLLGQADSTEPPRLELNIEGSQLGVEKDERGDSS